MGKKRRKHPPKGNVRLRALWRRLSVALAVALSLLAAYAAMNQAIAAFDRKTYLRQAREDADRDAGAAEALLGEREARLRAWAYALREAGNTESAQILRGVMQGGSMLEARQLYLVDEDGYYYGSDGNVAQNPQYDGIRATLQTEVSTLRQGGRFLIALEIRPFTVDGSTFRWALAEFDSADYQEQLSQVLRCGAVSGQILDGEGREVLRLSGDRSLYGLLDTARASGYAAPSDLKRQILDSDRVSTVCQMGNSQHLLTSTRLPGRDWILLTLDPMPPAPELMDPVMVLYLCAVALMVGAVCVVLRLRRRDRLLREQVQAARDSCTQMEKRLEGLKEVNRTQTEFINSISFNIRTPLTAIVGFTALAKRHIREPQALGEHLDKVGDASAQLLSKLNEGLDATGWHRYVEEEPQPLEAERAIDLQGMRILLVEDNALNRDIGEAILSEVGFVVECAENGQIGFQKVATAKPGYYNLVLMDIQMPVMDGYEATTMIRRLRSKYLAEIPILAMTANVSLEDKRRAFEVGMDGYVEKPMNMEKLLSAIQKALSRSVDRG